MLLSDTVQLFIDSRKRGVTGARKKASDRTVEFYERNLGIFVDWLTTKHAILRYEDIKRLHIVQFLDYLDQKQSAGWSLSTVLMVLRALKAYFRLVDSDEDCQQAGLKGFHKYLPIIEKSPRRTDIPQVKDFKAFKANFDVKNPIKYRNYIITCLLLDNGIRVGELCNLRVDHCRLQERVLIVDGKTGPRPVPVTKEMQRLLQAWLKKRSTFTYAKDSPYVFISKRSPKLTPLAVSHAFQKHRKALGLPRMTPHSFRHAFCTNYLRSGGDIEKLRNITGHASYEMLKEYLHLAKTGSKAVQEEHERVSLLKEVL